MLFIEKKAKQILFINILDLQSLNQRKKIHDAVLNKNIY